MNYYGREWLTDLGSMEIYFTSCGSASVATNHDPWCWWFLQFPTAPSKWHFWPFALPSAQSCVNKRCGCGCPVIFVNLGTPHHHYNPTSLKKGSIDRNAKYAYPCLIVSVKADVIVEISPRLQWLLIVCPSLWSVDWWPEAWVKTLLQPPYSALYSFKRRFAKISQSRSSPWLRPCLKVPNTIAFTSKSKC